jgi:hypothetical protein
MTQGNSNPSTQKQPAPQRSAAWWEGFHARRERKPGIPPYGIGAQEYSDWADGWVDGAD